MTAQGTENLSDAEKQTIARKTIIHPDDFLSPGDCDHDDDHDWRFRQQLDQQAWALTYQGNRMMEILLDSRQSELNNLAILMASRPTLAHLMNAGEREAMLDYLEIFRADVDLDVVVVCSTDGEVLWMVGALLSGDICQAAPTPQVYADMWLGDRRGWLLASFPVLNRPAQKVIVGQALAGPFSDNLLAQIEMDHLLFIDGKLVGSSITDGSLEAPPDTEQFANWSGLTGAGPAAEEFVLGGSSYFSVASRYQDTRLYGVALLSAAGTVETQRELTRIGITGLAITMAGFAAGAVILSRRVSRPLEHLRRMAVKLRNGDLASPISVDTGVREVAEVAYALEDARVALQHTLEELRQENAWSDYLLEAVVEGVITLVQHGWITFFSQGAERITGRKQEQVLGKPADEIFPTADCDTRFSQSIPRPGEKPEIVTILVDDHPLTLSVNSGRLVPPEVGKASLVVSFRDITNEEAIRGLLGDFLSNITHEFRTPLTALAASIELLLDRLPDLNQDELYELLTSTHLGVLGLGSLIDNLLEGASIETGRFRIAPRPVELADVIEEALRVMEPLVSKNRQVLTVQLPPDIPLVRADPRRTTQVLVNLLSNAIKWAPQHSEIHLAGEVLPGFIKVLVTDQGPGISPEHKPDVFRRFDQKGARTERHASGTGLGLSVVKAIVESQGGSVGVEDRVGGGSVFWFTIPTADMTDVDEETG